MIATISKSTAAIRKLRKQSARAWRSRRSPLDPCRWIESCVKMTMEYEGRNERVSYQTRPWFRDIADACADPVVRFVRIKASTQVGKTLLLCSILIYLAENAPATAMVVTPNSSEAKDFRDRLYALAEESGLKIPPEHKQNMTVMEVGDMRIHLAWPTSKARMRSRRCKYIFRTEIDVYETRGSKDDPIESTNQRVKSFSRFFVLDESSPVPHPSRINKLETDSKSHRWYGACPHCAHHQEVRYFTHADGKYKGRGGVAGYKDDSGNMLTSQEARHSAYYICERGCTISQTEQYAFLRSGRWVPRGQSLAKTGRLKGKPVRTDRRELGYHLWAAHSHSWGDIAAEHVKAIQDGTLADFFQNWLGLSHRLRGKTPTWRELGSRNAWANNRGQVPSHAWFLTGGGDVQDHGVYVSIRGWGDRKTSWSVDWFYFQRQAGDEADMIKSDLAQIESAILDKSFEVIDGPNPRGRNAVGVALLCVDANHRTDDVHNWWNSLPAEKQARVRLIKGEAKISQEMKYKFSKLEHSQRDPDHIYEGGLHLWSINHDVFGIDLIQRLRAPADRLGAWYVTSDALDVGQFYLQQVVNEEWLPVRQKDGRLKYGWVERSPSIGHDFKDCEVYSMCAAQMTVDTFVGRPDWDASLWPVPDDRKKESRESTAAAVQRAFS